jgi:hypothetical protein
MPESVALSSLKAASHDLAKSLASVVFPQLSEPIRTFSLSDTTITSPWWTPKYSTLRRFTTSQHVSEQGTRCGEMILAHEVVKGLWSESFCEGYVRPRIYGRFPSLWIGGLN